MTTQRDIHRWALETFPHGTDASIIAHLREELEELSAALHVRGTLPRLLALQEEIADCVILLMNLASRHGISVEGAVDAKMAVNRQRKWQKTEDERGCFRHVEERS